MSEENNVSMETRRFVTASVNLLHAAFIRASRAQSKRHFARIQGGGWLDLAKLTMPDKSELMFRVALDHSAFRGRLGFTAFRSALAQLLGRLSERVRFKEEISVYSSEQTGEMLFNVPAILKTDGTTNVLMLGVDKPEAGIAPLRLMFLDPTQFEQAAGTQNSPAS